MSEEKKIQRETEEIKAGNHTLIVNTYITGREARDIEGAMMDKLEMSHGNNKETQIKGFKGSLLRERQDLQIKAVVVSIDGKVENIIDAILDLPSNESEEIINVVKEIAEPKKKDDDK